MRIAFTGTGDSMFPTIQDEDVVITEPTQVEDIEDNELYVVVDYTNQVWVKRIERHVNYGIFSHIRLHSDNKNYDTFTVSLREVKAIFKVVNLNK